MFSFSKRSSTIRLPLVGLAVIMIVALFAPSAVFAADTWGLYQHDARHTGQSSYSGPQMPTILWVVPFGDTGKPTTPISVGEKGAVYVGIEVTPVKSSSSTATSQPVTGGSGHSGVFAFSKDNKVLWVSKINGKVSGPVAVGADGTVYAAIGTTLAALNKENGSALWQVKLNGASPGGVTIASDGTVYAATTAKTLYAVTKDGKLKWSYVAGGAINNAPAVGSDGTVYVTAADKCLYAVAPSGSLRWKFAVTGPGNITLTAPTLASDNTVYFGEVKDGGDVVQSDEVKLNKAHLYAIGSDGKPKWRFETKGKKVGIASINKDNDIIFGGAMLNHTEDRELTLGDAFIYAVDPKGKSKWEADAEDNDVAYPILIDKKNNLYISSDDGHMTALSKTGITRWRSKTGGKTSLGPDNIMYIAANASIAAIAERSTKDAKRSEQLQSESSDNSSSSGPFALLIYLVPVLIAVGIAVFFKLRIGSSSDEGPGAGGMES